MAGDGLQSSDPMQSRLDRVNYLNAGLMVAAAAAAYAIPFHLFIFAYAILGPAHYLTEISWLHDRRYFAQRPRPRAWWLALVVAAMVVLGAGYMMQLPPKYEVGMTWLVFVTAGFLAFVRRRNLALGLIAASIIGLALFSTIDAYLIGAYLLVTIVHVFVFTAAFVLYGALKSRSTSALVSLAVFGLCSISFFVYAPAGTAPVGAVRSMYAFFETLNGWLLRLLSFSSSDVYGREGITVMRFIAFAYTYHYLNWFSKTSIIRWHEVSRRRIALVVTAWLSVVLIYTFNYELGIAVAYLLSLLHVLLEFPLNYQSFAGIARELRAWVSGAPAPEPSPTRA